MALPAKRGEVWRAHPLHPAQALAPAVRLTTGPPLGPPGAMGARSNHPPARPFDIAAVHWRC